MFIYHFGWLSEYLAFALFGVLLAYDVESEANTIKAFDYCSDDNCPKDNQHIMCRLYKPEFPVSTLEECVMLNDFIPLKPKWAKLIVKSINEKRGMIALGLGRDYYNTTTFSRAANYMKVHWDQKLATLSQLVAGYTCDPPDKFLDACCYTLKYPDPKMFHTSVYYKFPGWFMQHRDASLVYSVFTEAKMEETIKLLFDDFYLRKVGDDVSELPRYDGPLYSYSIEAIGCGYSVKRFNKTMTYLTLVCYVYPYKVVPLDNGKTLLYKTYMPPRKPICHNTTVSCTDMSSFVCQCPAGTYADEQCLCIKFDKDPNLCDVDSCDPDPPMFPIFGPWDPKKLLKTGIKFEETTTTTTTEGNRENVKKENLFAKQRKLRLHRSSKPYLTSEQKYAADVAKFVETLNMLEEKLKKIKLDEEKKKIISAKIKKIIEISDEKQILKYIFKAEPTTTGKFIDDETNSTSTAPPVKLYEKILEHRLKHKHNYDYLESYEDQDLLPKQEAYVGLYSDEVRLNDIERHLHQNTNFVDRYKDHHKTENLSSEEKESFHKVDVEENLDANDHYYGDYAYNEDEDHYQVLTQVTNDRPHNNNHENVAKLKNKFGVPKNLKRDPFKSKFKDEYDFDEYYDDPHRNSDYDYDENYSDYEFYDYEEDLVEERKFFYEKKLRALYKAKPLYTKRGAFTR